VIFVTACDHRYFAYLKVQIKNTYALFGKFPIVYDLGLRDYKRQLEQHGVKVKPKPAHVLPGKDYPRNYYPKALHKPYILLDVSISHDEPILYMDADARPIKKFKIEKHDIIVSEVDGYERFKGTELEPYRGPVHSGVIYLNNFVGRDQFLLNWIYDMEADPLPSDKKSFNKVIKDYDVHILPEIVFDARKRAWDTLILHAK